jgi:hypothetical protein
LQPLTRRTAAAVLAALLVAGVAVWRFDPWGEQGSGLSKSFQYDLEPYQKTDPTLIGYAQTGRIAVGLVEPRAVAVGPEDRVYVAGDRDVHVHAAGGARLRQISLDGAPQSLAVGWAEHQYPGRLYVGVGNHVEVFSPEGRRLAAWPAPSPKSLITSIAVGEHEVYLADAIGRIVLRYDLDGKLLTRIGARDEARNIRGFFIPSPYFDVALGGDGLLRVVNPAPHRIEAFTPDGSLELSWGKSSLAIEGFCGCCNPANIALLPDGRFVTAEKGIPRVKIYSPEGKFLTVVAGPELLAPDPTAAEETRAGHKLKVVDVAADSRGRVLVLDPGLRSVRIFEPKPERKAKS